MSITIATGSALDIGTLGTAKNMTAITNATEAVATLEASHGIIVGDYFVVTSGWDKLNGRVVRAKTVATNDVTLEGINTSDTTLYPAGQGTGSVKEVTAWTEITQISDVSVSGGDQQFTDISTIKDTEARQAPTTRSAVAQSLTVYDDPSLGWYATVNAAAGVETPLRWRLPNGSKLVTAAFFALQSMPNIAKNAPLTAKLDLSYARTATRYAT